MASYIAKMKEDPTTCKVSQYSIWETKFPNAIKNDGHFWVIRGTQRHPSRLLTLVEERQADEGIFNPPPSCEIIKVPKRYLKDFERRIESSLMNLAGRASMSQEVPFDDLTQIEDKSLCPTLYFVAPLASADNRDPKPLRNQLPKEILIQTPQGYRFRRYPGAPRYGHADLAAVSSAGLAIIHKELSITGKVLYVADLIIRISSPNRVNLDAVREFIIDLRDYYGLSFHSMTADQYQSEQLLQKLTSITFATEVEVRSVVKDRIPYDTLSAIVAQDSLKTGPLRDLWGELEGVYFNEKNRPVKQYIDGSHGDLADALVGAVYNAVLNPLDVPVNIYETYGQQESTIRMVLEQFKRIA